MQEILPAPSVILDPQQYSQHHSANDASVSQVYASLVAAPPPDSTLPSDPAVHMHSTITPPLFAQPILPSTVSAMSMHMSMDSLSSSDATVAMDVMAPPQPPSGSPSTIPDLSAQAAVYGIDPRIATLDTIDPSHSLLSSPSANSASTGASHASSPALTGVAPSYTTGSSSLASALDSLGTTRSRSGSAASPGNTTTLGSDLGFPSAGSAPPTSSHASGFDFPPTGYENSMPTTKAEEGPPGGAHLMVLGDLLKKCA